MGDGEPDLLEKSLAASSVYLLLSTLDFLEEGDAFLLVDGGGL